MPNATFLALQAIQQSPKMRRILQDNADRIATRLRAITDRDRLSKKLDVVNEESGTRPGTNSPKGIQRAYVRVGITNRTRGQADAEIAQALGTGGGGTISVTRQAVSGARKV